MTLQPDTRKLLTTASILIGVGVLFAALMLTVFGGVTHQGPHTNMGWIALVVVMGCLPLGCITLFLALAKLIGNRSH